MVGTAYIDNDYIKYLHGLFKKDKAVVGLILGQPLKDKEFIVHLTKTPHSEDNSINLGDVSENALAEHAKHTTRMLPGGMYVRGIFAVTSQEVLNPLLPQLKNLLAHLHTELDNNSLVYGNPDSAGKLILHYNGKDAKVKCSLYDINADRTTEVNLRISNDMHFIPMECKFEINEVIPIVNTVLALKTQLKYVISRINTCLKNAVFLFDDILQNKDDEIEPLRKATLQEDIDKLKTKQVNILLSTNCTSGVYDTEILDSIGILRISGLLACNIWLHPSTTYERAMEAIKEDICRSLITRLAMHFDSLTEGERGQFYESSCVHEPPRRVLIPLPYSKIMLSDYLFPGEGPQETLVSFQDVLDIRIMSRVEVKDLEGQADLTDFYRNDSSKELPLSADEAETNRVMYFIGAGVALLVLIISLLIHFLTK